MGIIIINGVAGIILVVSLIADRRKTLQGLLVGLQVLKGMLPLIIVVIILVGLMLGFIPESVLAGTVGGKGGTLGLAIATVFGSFVAIPSVAIFPLAISILKLAGAETGFWAIATVGCLITTNSMVACISLPIEMNVMGSRAAFTRLTLCFVAAVSVGLLMGVILNGYHI
ncbi:MAG: hypothetical protein V1748_13040 [Actinomycetota bacterium]